MKILTAVIMSFCKVLHMSFWKSANWLSINRIRKFKVNDLVSKREDRDGVSVETLDCDNQTIAALLHGCHSIMLNSKGCLQYHLMCV